MRTVHIITSGVPNTMLRKDAACLRHCATLPQEPTSGRQYRSRCGWAQVGRGTARTARSEGHRRRRETGDHLVCVLQRREGHSGVFHLADVALFEKKSLHDSVRSTEAISRGPQAASRLSRM